MCMHICAHMCVQILSQMNRWENFSPNLHNVPPFLIIYFALKKPLSLMNLFCHVLLWFQKLLMSYSETFWTNIFVFPCVCLLCSLCFRYNHIFMGNERSSGRTTVYCNMPQDLSYFHEFLEYVYLRLDATTTNITYMAWWSALHYKLK